MALDVAEVEQALLALAPHDRAVVIHRGLLSLDDKTRTNQVEVDFRPLVVGLRPADL